MTTPSKEENDIIKIDDIPEPDVDMYYRFMDARLVTYFTNTVRASFEYKNIIAYMKTFMDFESCTYYEGYSMKNGFRIELHHTPFTLFDITEAVANKHMKLHEKVKTMDVCEEVAQLHFQFKVGFVPLNPTAHDLFHSGALEIHPSLIRGFWEDFYKDYKEFLSPEAQEKYNHILELRSMPEHLSNKMPQILQKKPILLEVKNIISLTKVDLNQIAVDTTMKRLEEYQGESKDIVEEKKEEKTKNSKKGG